MESNSFLNEKEGSNTMINILLLVAAALIIVAIFMTLESLFISILLSLIVALVFILIIVRISRSKKSMYLKQTKRIKEELDKKKEQAGIKEEIGRKKPPQEEKEESQLIASESSGKYHTKDCRYAKNIKGKKKVEGTAEELEDEGFEACKVCNPKE